MKKTQLSGRLLPLALVAAMLVSLFVGLTPAVAASDIAPLAVSVKPFTPAYDFQDDTKDMGTRLNNLIGQLTLEEKIAGGGTINRLGVNGGRAGGGEGLHGVAGSQATVFPSSLGLSQTWDDALLEKIGDIIAKESEAGAAGGISRLTPVLDLLRDPRYGRAYETYGEDAFLTGSLGTAIGKGMTSRTEADNGQEYLQFLPNVKHPLAYNNEINRLWTNSSFTPRNTYEYYIKAFKYPVSAGVLKSLMNSYPLVIGKPMSVHPLQDALLKEWTPNYPGTGHYEFKTVNDYGSGSSIFVHSQRYFPDNTLGRALGVAEGTKNGQMSWSFRSYGNATALLYDALARGMVEETDFTENAKRTVAINLRTGDLDHLGIQNPYFDNHAKTRTDLMQTNKATAFEASQEQIVLLKNDGILPLSSSTVSKAVLLGPLADQILNDHYSGGRLYSITLKDALENTLGKNNIFFNRAVDTIAIKAPNGKYLVNADNRIWRTSGTSNADDTPVLANSEKTSATLADTELLFERHDYGSTYNLLRTPINNQYIQVASNTAAVGAHALTMINNTSSPGEANQVSGATNYVVWHNFRFVPVKGQANTYGLYNLVAGNGANRPNGTGLAYDQDDEDLNNGSYVKLDTATGRIVADIDSTGPYRNEQHTAGPDITQSKVDNDGNDDEIDNLPANDRFVVDTVQSSEDAINAAIAAAGDPSAPVILVLGYEPHLNAREAIDLYQTGLSDQQMRIINRLTKDIGDDGLERDVILVIKTGSPMTIDKDVQDNPRVKAILEIGHTGQEEGSALVSVLFDGGYKAPKTGFAPARPNYNLNGDTVPAPFDAYPGHSEDEAGEYVTIPGASPAGRLTATWYDGIEQMKGASEDHPPASYRFPDYSEATNDNLSNMNGTINNGIMVYDIIKGERTYQYLPSAKVPLYPFGYGLSYGQFEYSNVAVSAISDGKFTVSGKVKNTGSKTSDEVVQIYSAFADTESRIKQPIKKLIAYERLHDIAPGDEESFSFVIDLQDKLGVWDVESGGYVVEAGAYVITAGGSSADADDMDGVGGNDAMLTVAVGVGVNNGVDLTATKRDLKKLTLAENLDDYSEKGEQVDDIETVSASIAYKSNTAIQFRKDGAWISFKNVDFTSAPARLTVQAGSDRTGSLTVYALPTGGDPDTELTAATTIATIALTDTRPGSLATGLGIGPVGVYPGSVDGQTYKDAYVKPEWRKYGVNVTVTTGTYDIYIETEKRGAVLEWLQFNAPETATDIAIDQLYSLDSIREKSGALTLSANLTPVTALDAVAWSVANKSGTGAALAEINAATGVLTATGANNGTVTVTVTAGNQTATKDILITNQLDSNKVTVDSQNLTVDYLLLRTGAAFGANDNISRWQGTNQQTAVFLAPERVNIGGAYFLYATPGSGYTTLPANALDWAVYGSDGVSATTLATIDQAGLLTAAGTGNGDVVVKATLKNNLDIFVTRTIRLQNQSRKDGRKMIQAENWDTATAGSTGNPATTYMAGGNEVGLYQTAAVTAEVNQAVLGYKKVDFGTDAGSFQIRMATTASSTLELWIDGQNTADGGVKIGGPTIIPAGASYATYRTVVLPILPTSGEHDLYLVTTATASGTALTNRLNYFQLFSLGTGEVATYTVTFNPNGGTVTTPSQVVLIDTPATEPTAASRHGYTFSGWYTAATTGSKWNFANPVTSDLILYAHWAEVPSSGYTPTGPTTPSIPSTPVTPDAPSGPLGGFSDAGQVSSWATEFVERLVEAEIISGRPNGTIDPRGNVTRAEFTKMIVLGLKLEAGEAPKSFADVTAGDWFKSVVDIASSHEIVLGVSETAFAPNRTITRQDLCTIVYRGLVALDVTLPAIEDGGAFPDEAQIASYALDAVKTLRQLNIVTGRSSGVFDPRAYATREETAKIICGVIDYVASASASAPVDSTEPASTEPAA